MNNPYNVLYTSSLDSNISMASSYNVHSDLSDQSSDTFCNEQFNDCIQENMEGLVGRFIIFGDWGELCNSHQKKNKWEYA